MTLRTFAVVIHRAASVELLTQTFHDRREADLYCKRCEGWFKGIVGAAVVELTGEYATGETPADVGLFATEGHR